MDEDETLLCNIALEVDGVVMNILQYDYDYFSSAAGVIYGRIYKNAK